MTREGLTAFIFARGGSKGIKDKNIRTVAGQPLIAHSIACALASRSVARVMVSTDSEGIADVARAHGADVILRPAQLAADDSPELLAWKHAVAESGVFGDGGQDLFLSLPATSPLRSPADVDASVAKFRAGGCDILFGITPSRRSPYLNMVTIGSDGLIRVVIDGSSAYRRQDVPDVYDITTSVYVSTPAYVLACQGRLSDGKVGHIIIPPQRSLDIDDPFDLHLAGLLLKHPFSAGADGAFRADADGANPADGVGGQA
jgi:CMP-N-acetylneuraminic acid synthetase